MERNIFNNVTNWNSSTSTLETSNIEKRDNWILLPGSAENILFQTKLYLLIFIMLLNFIGNSLIIAIMTRARLQRASFSIYFMVVALADIGVGICGDLNAILLMNGVNIEIISHFVCRLRTFVLAVCQQLSGYGLSALSVDRCIAICLSHKSQILCTKFRAKIASLLLCLVAISINLHVFWTSGLRNRDSSGLDCVRYFRFRYFVSHVVSPVNLFLYAFGPSVIMMTCNVMTIVKVKRSERSSEELRAKNSSFREAARMLRLMLFVTGYYVMATLAKSIYRMGIPWFFPEETWIGMQPNNIVWSILTFLTSVNHSINFVLYVCSGGIFRQELIAIFRKPKFSVESMRSSSENTNSTHPAGDTRY